MTVFIVRYEAYQPPGSSSHQFGDVRPSAYRIRVSADLEEAVRSELAGHYLTVGRILSIEAER